MAGRQAGVFGGPFERAEHVRIGDAGDQRPRAADHAFDDGIEQAGRADSDEQEADPHHDGGQHELRHARQARQRGETQKQNAERPQEPARFAEVGYLVERPNDPVRQMAYSVDRRGVDQKHHGQEDRQRHTSGDGEPLRIKRPRISHMTARRAHQHRDCRGHIGRTPPQHGLRHALLAIESIGHGHGFSVERNTVSITGRPMLML